MKRRDFLRHALLGPALLGTVPVRLQAAVEKATGIPAPDLILELKATEAEASLLKGPSTRVWLYRGKVLKGDPQSLAFLPDPYPLPILRARKGQRVRIEFVNALPEQSIIHWHGLHVPEAMDGHPRYVIGPGKRYVYEFEIRNRAGTYWFHPHPHGHTGKQIYFGLAGLFLVSDEEEQSLGLPSGEQDVTLVLQDRSFDGDNQLIFLPDAGEGSGMSRGMMDGGMMGGMMGGGMMGGMMARMMGFLGDRIVVNGQPDFTLPVATRPYRLRLLNASNSRIYKLAWSDGAPLTVIASDGGLLPRPVKRPYLSLAPAERAELWVDFGRWPPGTELTMESLPFTGIMEMGGGMMGGMMGAMASALPNGARFPVFRVRVEGRGKGGPGLPSQLTAIPAPDPRKAVNWRHPRVFHLTLAMMQWGINRRQFQMEAVAPDEKVRLDTAEVWEFANDGAMGMMAMAHPMHIHGLQFRVLERRGGSRNPGGLHEGLVEEGWKDTVLVMPGERVKVLLDFREYPGLFVFHCHNLEHADSGMMRNYLVQA